MGGSGRPPSPPTLRPRSESAASAARCRPGPVSIILLLAALVGGCGYSVRGHLPDDVRTVAVPILVNRTMKPAVETEMTRAIATAFATDGRLKVVSRDVADALL